MGGSKDSSGSPSSFAESINSSQGVSTAPEAERYATVSGLEPEAENAVQELLMGMGDPSWRVRSIALEVGSRFSATPDFLALLFISAKESLTLEYN